MMYMAKPSSETGVFSIEENRTWSSYHIISMMLAFYRREGI